jgi:hypothetical protein
MLTWAPCQPPHFPAAFQHPLLEQGVLLSERGIPEMHSAGILEHYKVLGLVLQGIKKASDTQEFSLCKGLWGLISKLLLSMSFQDHFHFKPKKNCHVKNNPANSVTKDSSLSGPLWQSVCPAHNSTTVRKEECLSKLWRQRSSCTLQAATPTSTAPPPGPRPTKAQQWPH